MKTLLHRLLDRLIPSRAEVRQLEADIQAQRECLDVRERTIRIQHDELQALNDELAITRRERDTARRQFAETKSVNLHNAQAHRATEVAMLRQNHELQVAQAMLSGKAPDPELAAAAKEVPALRVPKYLPVEEPKEISP
jgi:predicted  nucleic acid-binding Zn-ribbon protein